MSEWGGWVRRRGGEEGRSEGRRRAAKRWERPERWRGGRSGGGDEGSEVELWPIVEYDWGLLERGGEVEVDSGRLEGRRRERREAALLP